MSRVVSRASFVERERPVYAGDLFLLDGQTKQTETLVFVHDTPEAQSARYAEVQGKLDLSRDGSGAANAEVDLVDERGNVVQSAFVLTAFVRRLVALVPPPNAHLTNFHGATAFFALRRASQRGLGLIELARPGHIFSKGLESAPGRSRVICGAKAAAPRGVPELDPKGCFD